jgi:hypothetical protein
VNSAAIPSLLSLRGTYVSIRLVEDNLRVNTLPKTLNYDTWRRVLNAPLSKLLIATLEAI